MINDIISKTIEESFSDVSKELPEPSHGYGHYEDIHVKMSDGVKLMTRVFFPDGKGPWPVILWRSPYYALDELIQTQMPWFTKYGYVAVCQITRGILESDGEWLPFENERKDGLDTVNWIVEQKWMNGNIGTFGASYMGHVQWCIADQVPPEVKTMYISVFGGKPYELFYMDGMFRTSLFTPWALAMAEPVSNTIRNKSGNEEKIKKSLFVTPHIEMDKKIIGKEYPWYRNWISNPNPGSDYWNKGFWKEYREVLDKVDIPVTFQSGWFDIYLSSVIKTFNELPERTRIGSRLVIGPWHHGSKPGGDLEYPDDNILGPMLMKDALEWFDHYLKGAPYPRRKGVIEAYAMREGKWKTWEGRIEPSGSKKLYLCIVNGLPFKGGKLDTKSPERFESVGYEYDPQDPVLSKGGNILMNYGHPEMPPECSTVQDEPGTRRDVVSFVSEELKEDMRITGNIKIHLSVKSDAEDTSFTVKVMEVFPDGKAYNIQDGITTLAYRNGAVQPLAYTPGEIIEVGLELLETMWKVKKGSRIRVDISSSNFPAYHVHPNTSGIWAIQENARIANQTLYTGGTYPAYVDIPFID